MGAYFNEDVRRERERARTCLLRATDAYRRGKEAEADYYLAARRSALEKAAAIEASATDATE